MENQLPRHPVFPTYVVKGFNHSYARIEELAANSDHTPEPYLMVYSCPLTDPASRHLPVNIPMMESIYHEC